MNIYDLLNRDIPCSCGRKHRCNIRTLQIASGALEILAQATQQYTHILLVADNNTYALCGERVRTLLTDKFEAICYFDSPGFLIPDEKAIAKIESQLSANTDLILGIGSGVINDLCKYVSYTRGIRCGIVATATSMDGYASSGAAMILQGMKVTHTTHAPNIIIGDTDILCAAPMDMIRAGYADIIGKYSALCDWKLSHLVNHEYLCPFIYDLVMEKTDKIRGLADAIVSRQPYAVGKLMETLVLVGVCLTLLSTTRPGSGSEHHLFHFYEVTGLIENKPYFLHGIDVGYATVVTAGLREKICKIESPVFYHIAEEERMACYKKIYLNDWTQVRDIQAKAGWYDKNLDVVYRTHWNEIRQILAECPAEQEMREMLISAGFDLDAFEKMYGAGKIQDSIWFAKDLKDRCSVLWLYFELFLNEKKVKKIYETRNI